MPGAAASDEREELRTRRIDYCKRSSKFIFTNIGLGLLMIVYTAVGALVFQRLETTNEKELCTVSMNKYDPMENQTANDLWSLATSYESGDGLEDELEAIGQVVRGFKSNVMELGYDGTNCTALGEAGGPQYKWSFSGSILFAVTVFTTVGYGNIAPKTFWGRLVCIVYAFIGIPLMLLFLANVGEVMADVFRFVYAKVCCCGCCDNRKSRGDAVSESRQNLAGSSEGSEGSGQGRRRRKEEEEEEAPKKDHVTEDGEEEEEEDNESRLGVPLTITLTVVAVYIFMGSLLFGTWEKWTMLQSAYYCFITISTIGFGDVVPGTEDMNSPAGQLTMIGAAVYLIFGMAIMSMAFNLIQEEMVGKFVWISEKLGLSKKEEDEEYPTEGDGHSLPQQKQPGGASYPSSIDSDPNSLIKMAASVLNQPGK